MTSVLDQYAQATQTQNIRNVDSTNKPEMTTSGYIQMKLHEEVPIFSKNKLNFEPSDNITHLVVSSNYLVLAMANAKLFRIDLNRPERQEEISFGKYTVTGLRLANLFLDPLGYHLLMAFVPKNQDGGILPELIYLSRDNVKLRPTKFRHEITAVAWNHFNVSEVTTGSILLGTSKGYIFETEIGSDGDKLFQTSIEQYWKQLFDIGKGNPIVITGMEFHRLPNADRYFVIVTTPNRLYQFIGNANSEEKPLLQQIFTSYLNVSEKFQYVETTAAYSKLCFSPHSPKSLPKSFAWLTGGGIYYEDLNPYEQEKIADVANSFDYPKSNHDKESNIPLNFVLTNFHALLLYNYTIRGVCTLNKEVVFEDTYPDKLMNIVKDPVAGTIWTFTKKKIYRFKVSKEERNVWKIYCGKKQFDLAKQYCKDNPAHLDQVLVKEAEDFFERADYSKSAQRYAETQTSFEEVCLKFLRVNEESALKTFLRQKLSRLKVYDKTQITLIVLWLIELYLKHLGQLRNQGLENSVEYQTEQSEFDAFLTLTVVNSCITNNKPTVYELMSSHGDQHNLTKLLLINMDYEQVIRQHIYKNNFTAALNILNKQNDYELYYKFVPILIQEIPSLTVKALISLKRNVSPVKLLPALVGCEQDELHINETLRYLEHCVLTLGTNERAIHNYLLCLYAKHKPESKLMHYLATQGQDASMVYYDVHYALQLCQERGLTEACVQLSAMLGLWESAVDLALTLNIDKAKQTANMPQNDNELKKKLWLKIAKHVISGKNDIQKAMQFLNQCDLIKIEDVLPFFSDFDTIDHFKNSICSSLQEYNQHIQDLKDEMKEATKAAELIREEIQQFRNNCTVIQPVTICSICKLALLIRPVRPFYYFPCNHYFHADCLLKELHPLLGPAKQNKLSDLHRKLENMSLNADNVSTNSASLPSRDLVKAEIDNILASECLYCGEYMIRDIDTPFINDKQFDQITKEWVYSGHNAPNKLSSKVHSK